jgi:hypothetical protein
MPAIKNLNFIADMGRMNGALPSAESRGSLPAPIVVLIAPPSWQR